MRRADRGYVTGIQGGIVEGIGVGHPISDRQRDHGHDVEGCFSASTLLLSCVENRVCLSPGVLVIGAAWWVATRIMAGVGDQV
jgi:hypothetical protein